jgi:hypothetical protein
VTHGSHCCHPLLGVQFVCTGLQTDGAVTRFQLFVREVTSVFLDRFIANGLTFETVALGLKINEKILSYRVIFVIYINESYLVFSSNLISTKTMEMKAF